MKAGETHPASAAYAELAEQWAGTDERLHGPEGRPGPELAARAIADSIEDPTTPCGSRWATTPPWSSPPAASSTTPPSSAAMREVVG